MINKLPTKSKKALRTALNKMLELANDKLERAKAKDKQWDIEHYTNDVEIIKNQLKEL